LSESDVVRWSYANVHQQKGLAYLSNAILVTDNFCYRYSTINNSDKK